MWIHDRDQKVDADIQKLNFLPMVVIIAHDYE